MNDNLTKQYDLILKILNLNIQMDLVIMTTIYELKIPVIPNK